MLKKYLLSFALTLTLTNVFAQFEFTNRSYNVPVTGMNWGFVGGGFTAMLNNRDDQRADKRLDPQMMNFQWAAGIEGIYWFQPTFGFGGQALYWNGGAAYTGYDTLTKYKLSAQTSLTYLKVPLMFYFKSYNRYYPNQRFRLNLQFGPYIAVMQQMSDKGTIKDENGDKVSSFSISNQSITDGQGFKGKLNATVMSPLDAGFVFGLGGEVRLWKRTVVALMIRTDVGITNAENRKGLKVKWDGHEEKDDFNYWGGYYAKYIPATTEDYAAGYGQNRRATKNFSVGGFLSIRKYF